MVSIHGLMVEPMKDLGKTIICMAKEHTLGVMGENMKENIIWIRNMGTECITGLMVGDMKDSGVMESNMEKVNIYCRME
jgi:hypothetical protein